MKIKKYPISVYELFLLLFTSISFVGITLLALNIYSPVLTLFVSSLLLILLILFKVRKVELGGMRVDYILVGIILIAAVFRFTPSLYLEGGQDQGVYVSMSKQYEINKGLYIKDSIKNEIVEGEQEKYDSQNLKKITALRLSDNDSYDYQFSFYPAHPLWLSMSGFIFGEDSRTTYLFVVSLLSIINIFLLAREVSKSRSVGYIAAFLLAINPAHVFFSNFPVTEILMLFLTSGALYYLAKSINRSDSTWSWGLTISLALFAVSFFTRITSVILLPVLMVMYLGIMRNSKKENQWIYQKYFVLLGILFISSLLFYYLFIPSLLSAFFSASSLVNLIIIAGFIFLLYSTFLFEKFVRKIGKWKDMLGIIYKHQKRIVQSLLVFLVIYSLGIVYIYGFTDIFSGTVYDSFWGIVGSGLNMVKDLSLTSFVLYISPFGFIAYLYFVVKKLYKGAPFLSYINVLFLVFLAHSIVVLKFIPHHYYFVRYQVSELIPYGILLSSVAIYYLIKNGYIKRFIGISTLFLWGIYSLIFSIPQIGNVYGVKEDVYASIEETVAEKDVVFYIEDSSWPTSFLATPLKFYYGMNVVLIEKLSEIDGYARDFSDRSLYLISAYKIPDTNLNLEYVKELSYTSRFMSTARSIPDFSIEYSYSQKNLPLCPENLLQSYCEGIIPIQYVTGKKSLFMYRIVSFN